MAKKKKASRAPCPGSGRFSEKDKQLIAAACTKIGRPVTPERLLFYAKPARSPIHHLFTWNDAKAAHILRLEEARACLAVWVTFDSSEPRRLRYPVTINSTRGPVRSYELRSDVIGNEESMAQIARSVWLGIRPYAMQARDLGLCRRFVHWKRLVQAFEDFPEAEGKEESA